MKHKVFHLKKREFIDKLGEYLYQQNRDGEHKHVELTIQPHHDYWIILFECRVFSAVLVKYGMRFAQEFLTINEAATMQRNLIREIERHAYEIATNKGALNHKIT